MRFLIAASLVACATACGSAAPPAASPAAVTPPAATAPPRADGLRSREEVVTFAQRYVDLVWVAREEHAFHDLDGHGTRVDTPDESFVRDGWKAGPNTGMPYAWGGSDTPEDFARKIADGVHAGHVPRSRSAPGSEETAGIDCSGLVARSWGLPRTYATAELPSISMRLTSFDDLLPGDVINKPKAHVMIFVRFAAADRQRVHVIEGGAWDGRAWRVVESEYDVARLEQDGFFPLRDARRSSD
jgi:hypothetical protein